MAVSSVTTSTRTSQPIAASTYAQPHLTMEPDRSFDEEDQNVLTKLVPYVEQFMSDSEYEELDTDDTKVLLLAGSLAGVAEHWAMYPIDLIKTRMQAINQPHGARYQTFFRAVTQTGKTDGFRSLYRGGSVVVCGAIPAHAAYFGVYEKGKEILGQDSAWSHLASGGCAAIVHDAVMTPTDAIKQRMQVHQSVHKSARACIGSMYKEGVGSFYRSFSTQICMNIPQQCLHFALYEQFKRKMNPTGEYNVLAHLVCGGLAGGAAAFITTPLDVTKTFLNTQNTQGKPVIRGVWNGFKTVRSAVGVSGLYKGCTPRTIQAATGTAIIWAVYEGFKKALSNR